MAGITVASKHGAARIADSCRATFTCELMNDDLLQKIESAKGITTRDLLAEIKTSRRMGIWPHAEPTTLPELQRLLRVLQGTGQICVTPDGWFLASQVPKVNAGARELPMELFQ